MAAIKSLDQASDKWVRRASVAGADYETGVKNPKRPWAESAKAGKANYVAGINAANARDAFSKGIDKAGDATWLAMATKKGPSRFAEGVAISKEQWSKGFAPYRAGIESLNLAPRGPRGSVANYERSKAVGTTLRAIKEKM